MKLKLKTLNIEMTIGNFTETDVSELIGNLLHRESTTVPISDLARKIYYDDEVEVSQMEYDQMMKILAASQVKRFVIVAIEQQVKEQ